jgi:hypothetical protein
VQQKYPSSYISCLALFLTPQVIPFIFTCIMGFYSVASPSIPLIPGLESFLGDHLISNVVQLSSSQCEGVVYVIACYFDVIEGVDMWYGDDKLVT